MNHRTFAALIALCPIPLSAAESASPAAAVFDGAVAVWHMADLRDSAGKDSRLTVHGNVRAGVALDAADREASLRRGGDGLAAVFDGGYLSADQGADGELNLKGTAMTLAVRLRDPSGAWNGPLLSKHGGHNRLVYNLFSTRLTQEMHLGFELGTDHSDRMLQISVPLSRIGPTDWHDVVIRFTGPRLELFVDGVLVDEEWPIGSLRGGNTEPCLIGAESVGGSIKAGFRGLIDHAALWNRALSDADIALLSGGPDAVARRDREILGDPAKSLQYWRPRGHNANVGDCLPFFHNGRYHLYYLFDRRHHRSKWGLGAHQWAHASTTDLIHWEHHPMALPITESWEGSICTGSVFFHDNVYYAFYATRKSDLTQHLGVATSRDGIRFEKTQPNPYASAPKGYHPQDFRDPTVFRDETTGLFHLLVTAQLIQGNRGCLAQMVSTDLKNWTLKDPFLITPEVPECPDHFRWNGWTYLISTRYWMSRGPLGPWTSPRVDRLDVMPVPKTAEFTGGRRIAAFWLADGGWGGHVVFRELVQHKDGTLGTRFPPEMIPPTGDAVKLTSTATPKAVSADGRNIRITADSCPYDARLAAVPENARITLRVTPKPDSLGFSLGLGGSPAQAGDVELGVDIPGERVRLGVPRAEAPGHPNGPSIEHVDGLNRPWKLDIVVLDDIIDVCIDDRRTLITRQKGPRGRWLLLRVNRGEVAFDDIEVRPILR